MDKAIAGIKKAENVLDKINHIMSYVVLICWLLVGVVYLMKMVIK